MADTKAPERGSRSALVLSGGGARGAYEAGVVAALYDAGERFDVICGTSIGAINGALIAQRPRADTLRDVWNSISQVGVIKAIPQVDAIVKFAGAVQAVRTDPVLRKAGDLLHAVEDAAGVFPIANLLRVNAGLDPDPVQGFLATHLNFAQLQLPFIFASTNLTHGASQVFYAFPPGSEDVADAFALAQTNKGQLDFPAVQVTAGSYAEAVRSSGSIPIAFPPVAVPDQGGCVFVDGGVANNTPIGQAVDAGATHITVIFMDPATDAPDSYPTGTLANVAAACYAVMSQTILQADFDIALRTNAAAGAGPSNKRQIALREIRPAKALPLTILDFDKQDLIEAAFQMGRDSASKAPAFVT